MQLFTHDRLYDFMGVRRWSISASGNYNNSISNETVALFANRAASAGRAFNIMIE